jgi:hypothetical protein
MLDRNYLQNLFVALLACSFVSVGEILSSNSISGTIPNLLLLCFFDPHANMRALSVSVSGGQRLVSIRVRATSAVLTPPVSDPNWDPSRYRKFPRFYFSENGRKYVILDKFISFNW